MYLDNQATTPLDPRVLDAMLPSMTQVFGNAHSRTHKYGWDAESAVEDSRQMVADLLGANAKEIVFTSGATESNNIAVKGVSNFYSQNKKKAKHIVTTQTEHKCVLDSCRYLQERGWEITYLPVQPNGLVDLKVVDAALREDTVLCSVMMVNNEIGVVQPIKEIGALCRAKGVFFHSDIAQALGKIPVDVNELNLDLASISGHKLYGPKGIGALYVRRRPRVRVEAVFSGGGQERGIRSGTLPTSLIVGLGTACRIAREDMDVDSEWVITLGKKLKDGLFSRIPEVVVNGDEEHRYPGNWNISFAYVEGESALMALKEIAVSSGSACTSASLEPSYVLRALGVEEELAHTSLRFGIGRFTTEEEVDRCVDLCVEHMARLREMSPLYEMVKEGIDLKSISWAHH